MRASVQINMNQTVFFKALFVIKNQEQVNQKKREMVKYGMEHYAAAEIVKSICMY